VETALPASTSGSKSQQPVIQTAPTAVQAIATAPGNQTGQPSAKVSIESVTSSKDPVVVSRAQSGYRTLNKSAIQMVEAARDSIFRQVALRVNGGGGEMRLLLDPPGLGQLDLRVIVDKAGNVQLSMIAERPELALVLDKHMAELKQTLHSQGLTVAHAEVRARNEQTPNRGNGDEHSSSGEPSDEPQEWNGPALRRAGYITAEGLDFWV
jgi:flagellar hook-length control protein FliK